MTVCRLLKLLGLTDLPLISRLDVMFMAVPAVVVAVAAAGTGSVVGLAVMVRTGVVIVVLIAVVAVVGSVIIVEGMGIWLGIVSVKGMPVVLVEVVVVVGVVIVVGGMDTWLGIVRVAAVEEEEAAAVLGRVMRVGNLGIWPGTVHKEEVAVGIRDLLVAAAVDFLGVAAAAAVVAAVEGDATIVGSRGILLENALTITRDGRTDQQKKSRGPCYDDDLFCR